MHEVGVFSVLNLSYCYSLGAKAGDSPTGDPCEPSSSFAVGVGNFAPKVIFCFLFGLSVNCDDRLLLPISSVVLSASRVCYG